MPPSRCPRCGFSYAWNGRVCGHCPSPARIRQLWEQTARFTELVNSGKSITRRQRTALAVACLLRVRHLLPEPAQAMVDELDVGTATGDGPGPAAPARPMPHTTDPEQEVTNAVLMVADAVRGPGLETWTVQEVASRCSRAAGFRTWPSRHLLSFPLPPELEPFRAAVAAAVGNGDRQPHHSAVPPDPDDPVRAAYDRLTEELQEYTRARWDVTAAEEAAQCGIARDVLGYPEVAVSFDPGWRTDTVVAVARTLYAERDFSGMPILADALEEAGCADPEVLDHCRFAPAHVRGCWLLDRVLGLG